MFSRAYRSVGWFVRLSTIGNAYEANSLAQTAKKSISGPSGRRFSSAILNGRRNSASVVSAKRGSVCAPIARRSSVAATGGRSTLPENLRRNYEKFQVENGIPVYLKGGFADRILVGMTVVLIAVGLLDGIYTLLKMAFPKKLKK